METDCHAYSLTEQKAITSVPVSPFDTPPATCPPFSEEDLNDYVTRIVHQRDAAEKDYKFLDGLDDASPSTPAAPLTLPGPTYRRNRPRDLILTHSHWRRISGFEILFTAPKKASTSSKSPVPQPGAETTGVPGRF